MRFEVADCEHIPFDAGSFDAITMSAAYHHFPDVKAFAKEAVRVLAPGGKVYIAEVYLLAVLRVLCNPFVPLTDEGDVRFYSPKEIISTFERCGMRHVSTAVSGHIQIVCMGK